MLQELEDREELKRQEEEYRLRQEEMERQRAEQQALEEEEKERKKVNLPLILSPCLVELFVVS